MRSVLVAAIVTGIVATAAADPRDDKKRAIALYAEARQYLAHKDYGQACATFELSQKAFSMIGTQITIAECYERWGHTAAAYRAYVEAARLARQKHDGRARPVHRKVVALAPKVPHLHLVVPAEADPKTIIMFDAREIDKDLLVDDLDVEAGTHAVEARVAGLPTKYTRIDILPGETKRIRIGIPNPEIASLVEYQAPPKPVAEPGRDGKKLWGGIAMAGSGAIVVGVAGVVALGARDDYNVAISSCPNHLCETKSAFDATQAARSRANTMTYAAIGGIGLVAAGTFLILTSKRDPDDDSALTLAPVIAPGTIGFTLGGSM